MSQLAPRVLLFSPGDPGSDTRTDMYFGLHVILPTSFPRVASLIASLFFLQLRTCRSFILNCEPFGKIRFFLN